MSRKTEKEHNLICGKCNVALEKGTALLPGEYFPAEMLKCPCCGRFYIPEEPLQDGCEIEQTLEDK